MGVGRRENGTGSGTRLQPDTARYFRRVLETLEEGLSPEELALLAPTVLLEAATAGPGGVALDPGGSRVLGALLPRAPLDVLGGLLTPLILGGLGGPSGHPLGARVLESALDRVLPTLGEAGGQQDPLGQLQPPLGQLQPPQGQLQPPLGQIQEALGQLTVTVAQDLVAFARHPNGSFVLRALLRVLGGVPRAGPHRGAEPKAKGAGPGQKGAEPGQKGAEPPPAFLPLLGQLAEAFEEHLDSLLSPACASLCLQGALQALHRSQSPACSRLCRALIGRLAPPSSAPGESSLLRGLQDPELSRVLEAAMTVLDPPALRTLFQQHFRGHLRGVATHRVANHGLQRLLDHAPEDVVGEVLAELGPALWEPLAHGHPGVVTALVAACRRHPKLQQGALRCVFQAFGCWDPPERRRRCIGPLAGLRHLGGGAKEGEGEELEPPLGPITLHGSLLLQHLLHFRDPRLVLGGLQVLPHSALLALAHSAPGSHVWDAALTSPSVPPRARRRLLRRLQGHFLSLACHRNGSRVFDTAWASASGPARAAIAAELASQGPALQRDPYGRGVARSVALDLFLRHRKRWERLQAPPGGRRALAAILED